MSDGVRKQHREPANLAIVWASAGTRLAGRGRVVNYSAGGALIEIDHALTVGEQVSLVCVEMASLPPHAQVQWCQPLAERRGFQCGVSFAASSIEAVRWREQYKET